MNSCEAYHQLKGALRGPLDCQLYESCKTVRVAKSSASEPERTSTTNSGSCSPTQIRSGCRTVYTGAAMITRNPSCACPRP